MKAKAIVRLPFQSEKQLDAVLDGLTPEIQHQIGVRSKTEVTKEGLMLILTVKAADTVALRAALNAYLRWINSTLSVLQTVAER